MTNIIKKMNYFKSLILRSTSFVLTIVTFSFILNFSFISDGHSYIVCSTAPAGTTYTSGTDSGKSAEGAILVQDVGSGDITSFSLASNPTVFDIGGTGESCDITPDKYKIVLYRLGFCSENPFRDPSDTNTNTIKADLSSCNTIFKNDLGKELTLTPDGEIKLFDQPVLIPIGSYKYSYMIGSNHVSLQHTQKFVSVDVDDSSIGEPALIKGYHEISQDKELDRGTVCYTGKDTSGNPFVDTLSWEIDSSGVSGGISQLHGHDLPEHFPGTPKHTRYRCGTIDEAAAGLDWATTIINTLGQGDDQKLVQTSVVDGNTVVSGYVPANFRNASPCCHSADHLTGFQQFFNLLQDDNLTLATDMETARRILLVQINDDPTVISEDTVGFKVRFKTNNAINVRIYQEADAFGENRDEILHGTKMQANAIYLDFQTKSGRSRAGAWR